MSLQKQQLVLIILKYFQRKLAKYFQARDTKKGLVEVYPGFPVDSSPGKNYHVANVEDDCQIVKIFTY